MQVLYFLENFSSLSPVATSPNLLQGGYGRMSFMKLFVPFFFPPPCTRYTVIDSLLCFPSPFALAYRCGLFFSSDDLEILLTF